MLGDEEPLFSLDSEGQSPWFCRVGVFPKEESAIKSTGRKGLEEWLSGLSEKLTFVHVNLLRKVNK